MIIIFDYLVFPRTSSGASVDESHNIPCQADRTRGDMRKKRMAVTKRPDVGIASGLLLIMIQQACRCRCLSALLSQLVEDKQHQCAGRAVWGQSHHGAIRYLPEIHMS